MEFIDLKTQYHKIQAEMNSRIMTVLEHGQYILGPEVTELESQLAARAQTQFCISCASGTDALLMALMALKVGPGDAVFTTAFTFMATAEVIALLGATPVFVDIDPATFNISTQRLKETIDETRRKATAGSGSIKLIPKAVIAVDMFGLPCDYDSLLQLAKQEKLYLIEDAAQSFGARYKGKPACGFGTVAATSFFPAKPLGCYGDGGALFTNDPELAQVLRSIRVHGRGEDKYDNVRIGINGRLDTLQAAVLLTKLTVFDEERTAKQKVAAVYANRLPKSVATPVVPDGLESAWAQYSVRSPARDKVIAALKTAGTPTAVYYPKPLHLQNAFGGLGYCHGDFPHAELACREVFSLPMHAYLSESEQTAICETILNNGGI